MTSDKKQQLLQEALINNRIRMCNHCSHTTANVILISWCSLSHTLFGDTVLETRMVPNMDSKMTGLLTQ